LLTDRLEVVAGDWTRPREALRLALGLLFWAVLWLVMLSLTALSPPVDNVEQLTWVRSLQWGYYKHPPLPTWLLWPAVQLFGVEPWVSYVLGALLTCGAIALGWRLVAELAGRHVALLATLATLCVSYYNGRLYYYNHNIVLLLVVVAAAWFCWRAFADRSMRAWLGVGLMLGLGALAKYQVALAVLSLVAFWLHQRAWRDPLHRRGLLAAAVLAVLVFSPHAAWLVTHDFPPVRYAVATSLGVDLAPLARLGDTLRWIGDQINRLSPALLLGGGWLLWSRLAGGALSASGASGTSAASNVSAARVSARPAMAAELQRRVAAFLFCWGALPFVAIPLLGVAAGAELQFQWGTAFMALTSVWLMQCVGFARWQRVSRRQAWIGFAVIQLLLAVLNWVTSPVGVPKLMKHHARSFASLALAARIGPPARAALHGPIGVIAGQTGLAGTLALRLDERPLVLLNGNDEISPWVSKQDIARCGVLWVGYVGDADTWASARQARPEQWLPLPAERHELSGGTWWAVTPPAPGAGTCEAGAR
jgi:4-amino-4-deoxy-L-arabinose transferase-like glycosyltransferase